MIYEVNMQAALAWPRREGERLRCRKWAVECLLAGTVRHEDSLGKEPCGFLVTLDVRHVVGVC